MMLKPNNLLLLVVLLFLAGCENLDGIYKQLKDHENRLTKLETLVKDANDQLTALKTLVDAQAKKISIVSYTPLTDGSGYIITMSDGETITLKNGDTPAIGVKAHTDGKLYWTLNGEFLLDADGKMIRAESKEAPAPKLRVDAEGYWEYSSDGGKRWERITDPSGDPVKAVGDSPKVDLTITEENGNVIIIYDGHKFVVPKGKEYPDSPVTLVVTPHHYSATVEATPNDEELYYWSAVKDLETIASMTDDDIFASDVAHMEEVAKEAGHDLPYYTADDIFFKGTQTLEWSNVNTKPGTEYVAYAYAIDMVDGQVVRKSAIMQYKFTTKTLDKIPAKFEISFPEVHSNRVTLKAVSDKKEIPVTVRMFLTEDVEQYGLDALMQKDIETMETALVTQGLSWSDITGLGEVTDTYRNLHVGDKYTVVACGLEYGVITTDYATAEFTVPLPKVTDNTTFKVSVVSATASEMTLKVTPSNPATRYAAIMKESSFFETKDPEQFVSDRLYWLSLNNTIAWGDPSAALVFSGEQTLNTHDHFLEGFYTEAGKEYTILIFGVDETGERTTEIAKVAQKSGDAVAEKITFDIQFGEFKAASKYTHFQTITVVPSDPNAKYVVDSGTYSSLLPYLTSPEDMMNYWVSSYGSWLTLYSGEQTKTFSFSQSYEGGTSSWNPYVIFVFGYDGGITSDLYIYKIDSETGKYAVLTFPVK